MLAYRLQSFDTPPVLIDCPAPAPATGEVQIAVGACGLNFADTLMIRGKYQEMPAPPMTLGMEIAGTITALGDGVTGLAVGDRVAAYAGHGGMAEIACAPAARCLKIPESMRFEQAAAFQITYGSAHLALVHRARLAARETVLVLGAAGGAGRPEPADGTGERRDPAGGEAPGAVAQRQGEPGRPFPGAQEVPRRHRRSESTSVEQIGRRNGGLLEVT